jgi:hypothetical protein
MAYMLATASHEAREIIKFQKPVVGKNGQVVLDPKTNLPATKEFSLWSMYNPINEDRLGAGKQYFEAVKVEKTDDGAVITEKDGNRFKVSKNGVILKGKGFSEAGARGSVAGGPINKKYIDELGTEHQYFGRGFVQITWWDGYATAGVALGYGLDLLFNPEKVKEFDIAYEILVKGMLMGEIYGNRKKCADYLTNTDTDYMGARGMVNSNDKASEIAKLAMLCEALLMEAKKT